MQAKLHPKNKFFYLDRDKPEFGEIDVSEVGVSFNNGIPAYYLLDGRNALVTQAVNFKIAANFLLILYYKIKPPKRNKNKKC